MIEQIGFYFFSVCVIAMFGVSVFSKNIIYAMSALAGGMIFIAGFFFLLGAEFLGVIQIIVYVGAVLVLYAFAIMLIGASKPVKEKKPKFIIYALGAFGLVLLVFVASAPFVGGQISQNLTHLPNTNAIGMLLFTKYIVIFEIVALMLLVAMICAIMLVNKDMRGENER